MPAEVGVPRVRVHDVGLLDRGRGGHLQVDAQGLEGEVRAVQLGRGPERGGPVAVGAEAGDLDVDQRAQLPDEEVHVDPGAAVDLRRELPGQQRNSHGITLG